MKIRLDLCHALPIPFFVSHPLQVGVVELHAVAGNGAEIVEDEIGRGDEAEEVLGPHPGQLHRQLCLAPGKGVGLAHDIAHVEKRGDHFGQEQQRNEMRRLSIENALRGRDPTLGAPKEDDRCREWRHCRDVHWFLTTHPSCRAGGSNRPARSAYFAAGNLTSPPSYGKTLCIYKSKQHMIIYTNVVYIPML